MSDNFRAFSAEIGHFAEHDVPQAVQDVTAKIGLQALRGVVNKTPVDTGRARGNWQASLGSPVASTTNAKDPSGEAPLASSAQTSTYSREAPTVLSVPPFGTIWLSNNLPYIQRLESGTWSGQAPHGMVAVTVAEIESQFRRIE